VAAHGPAGRRISSYRQITIPTSVRTRTRNIPTTDQQEQPLPELPELLPQQQRGSRESPRRRLREDQDTKEPAELGPRIVTAGTDRRRRLLVLLLARRIAADRPPPAIPDPLEGAEVSRVPADSREVVATDIDRRRRRLLRRPSPLLPRRHPQRQVEAPNLAPRPRRNPPAPATRRGLPQPRRPTVPRTRTTAETRWSAGGTG